MMLEWICFIVFVLLVSAIFLNKLPRRKKNKIFEDVIALSYTEECEMHLLTKEVCQNALCSRKQLNQILNYVGQARKSLLICMFTLGHEAFEDVIINACKSGVDVRIITQHNISPFKLLQNLYNAGISIRTSNVEHSLMHNKFVVIDQELLITGSLNWTSSSFSFNYECVIISNSSDLVNKFNDYFEYMWKYFE